MVKLTPRTLRIWNCAVGVFQLLTGLSLVFITKRVRRHAVV
jgi:hypothetical protein